MPKSKQHISRPIIEGRKRGINTGLHFTFCNGRIVVGSEWYNVLGTSALILAPVGIFMGFEANAVGTSISWAVPAVIGFLTLVSLATLYCTAFLDPGYIPRQGETEEPDEAQLSKQHDVNGYTVQTKWCTTCNHYRPPRCSHCAACDNCVRKFDHHCPWVGTCVGERNYPFFLTFVFTLTLLDLLVFAFSWVRIIYLVHHENMSYKQAVKHEPANVALMIYTFFFFFFVGGLSSMHVFFTTQNVTTYEHFRSRYSAQGNPYDRGFFKNWAAVCCSWPPARLKETLPFRPVEDPLVEASYNRNYNGHSNSRHEPNGQHGNGDVELAQLEQGYGNNIRSLPSRQTSAQSTLDYSSVSDDEASAVSGQRRIPLVGNLGSVNRDLLDTEDSEFSEADHIRSHHSVVVVNDDKDVGGAISELTTQGDEARGLDVADIPANVEGEAAEYENNKSEITEDPSAVQPSAGAPIRRVAAVGAPPSQRIKLSPTNLANVGFTVSREQPTGIEERRTESPPPISPMTSGLPLGLADLPPLRPAEPPAQTAQRDFGFEATSTQEAQDLSDDETQYGSPRTLSVWPSGTVESFRTAGSNMGESEYGSFTASRQASRSSLTGVSLNWGSPAKNAPVDSSAQSQARSETSDQASVSKPTPAHLVGTKGDPEEVISSPN